MDARNAILDAIDAGAAHIARRLDLAVVAIAGLMHQHLQISFDKRGYRNYAISSSFAVTEAHQIVLEQLALVARELDSFVEIVESDASGEAFDAHDAVFSAGDALRLGVEQVRLLYARQFRDSLVARSPFRLNTEVSATVMTRAGSMIRAQEYFYLTARKGLLDYFNHAQIVALRNAGASKARVWHRDDDANPLEFFLVDGVGQTYADIAETFHPRANAVVGAVDVPA